MDYPCTPVLANAANAGRGGCSTSYITVMAHMLDRQTRGERDMAPPQLPEEVFQRHSRAQWPSVPVATAQSVKRLSRIQSTPSWIPPAPPPVPSKDGARPSPQPSSKPAAATSLWIDFIRLGKLVQGQCESLVCCRRDNKASLFMFRLVEAQSPKIKKVQVLHHPDILVLKHVIDSDVGTHIGFDYFRYTLEEALSVHIVPQEPDVHAIASSVFSAIKYLDSEGLMHGSVSTTSTRICGRTGKVVLGDCENASDHSGNRTNHDLESLGLTLLTCMEPHNRQARTAESVRTDRATNKVFGLSEPERWSGSKQLVDFVDDLFSLGRRPLNKLERPHTYVDSGILLVNQLLPFVELASLECFTMWQADEV